MTGSGDLLVAPVFQEGGEVDYSVPEETWTHLLSGETVTRPGWRRERYGFDSLPLLVRPGAVLPLGGRPDYGWPPRPYPRQGWRGDRGVRARPARTYGGGVHRPA
ncbi:hypothetical protein [Actinoallomurus iriomotensis]|uniref:Glycosyl hydrolase family 31 C-terminal domain-containing protein n=1 Tax=Actinoallomurus iriomotensis TaxID=478107 RepID=A0A9W6S5E7_9ACTN|nr:hypothetical protein Airi02_068900 [Actinoallomurus iriomotensis]